MHVLTYHRVDVADYVYRRSQSVQQGGRFERWPTDEGNWIVRSRVRHFL